LLWKLLLDEVVEELPALPGDGVAELKSRVAAATSSDPAFVGAELDRVLELGALVSDPTPDGTRWRWAES
jgi:hypothetical protein